MQHRGAPTMCTTINALFTSAGSDVARWRRHLVRNHLGPEGRLALFRTCCGGMNMVLTGSDHATMRLADVARDQIDTPVCMASVHAVKCALLMRGKLPTNLQLGTGAIWLMFMEPQLLGSATTWLDMLTLVVPPGEPLPDTTLKALARSCPNLTRLMIDATLDTLPSPEVFPKLQKLLLRCRPGSHERLLSSTAPYVKQLTGLSVLHMPGTELDPKHVPLLINPASIGASLHSLDIPTVLNDAVLGLLLACAPSLAQLHVNDIQLQSDMHAQRTATWQLLGVEDEVQLSSLARLPQASSMQLSLGRFVVCDVATGEAVAALAGAVARLQGRVTVLSSGGVGAVALKPSSALGVALQPAALCVGFRLLRACSTPTTTSVVLKGWVMSPMLLLVLGGLPPWQVLELVGCDWAADAAERCNTLLPQLPRSFRQLNLHADCTGLTFGHYKSICIGAPSRTLPAEAPFRIRLHGCWPLTGDAIQKRVRQMGLLANVVVSPW